MSLNNYNGINFSIILRFRFNHHLSPKQNKSVKRITSKRITWRIFATYLMHSIRLSVLDLDLDLVLDLVHSF